MSTTAAATKSASPPPSIPSSSTNSKEIEEIKPPNPSLAASTNPNPNPNPNPNKKKEPSSNDGKVEALSKLINADLIFIENTSERIDKYKDEIKTVSGRFKDLKKNKASAEEDYLLLKKDVRILKQHITSKTKDDPHRQGSTSASNITHPHTDKIPNFYKKRNFDQTLEFREFLARYNELSIELKLCLLCFSVFPENEEIKKRVMIYWWIGEGFVPPLDNKDTKKRAEEFANGFFNELIEKGFVEPVRKKRTLGVDTCKIHPFVRSMLIEIAKEIKFFDFDEERNAQEDYYGSLRACLMGKGLANRIDKLESLHCLFNVNEGNLEFEPEWFSRMKNVNVVYLGRWQTTPTHHIEVEETTSMKIKNVKVLDGLENIKHMRFLSLQGISRIMELPKSITKLTSLTILDLRACHNLETIPEGIGLLKNLTHLDMSECYLLDHMPKGIASLSKLQVLLGFVVVEESDSGKKNMCTLDDLQKLKELRKLSIHTGVNKFPEDTHLFALNQFEVLSKLTIVWGDSKEDGKKMAIANGEENGNKKDNSAAEPATADNKKLGKSAPGTPKGDNKEDGGKKDDSAAEPAKADAKKSKKSKPKRAPTRSSPALPLLPSTLEKLDLQCFPGTTTPNNWLKVCSLQSLKKLYIRGGKFCDLGQFQGFEEATKDKWKVEVLRLKYLTGLEMDWMELQELFPNLTYLEMVDCPKLNFFPCDGNGVWME